MAACAWHPPSPHFLHSLSYLLPPRPTLCPPSGSWTIWPRAPLDQGGSASACSPLRNLSPRQIGRSSEFSCRRMPSSLDSSLRPLRIQQRPLPLTLPPTQLLWTTPLNAHAASFHSLGEAAPLPSDTFLHPPLPSHVLRWLYVRISHFHHCVLPFLLTLGMLTTLKALSAVPITLAIPFHQAISSPPPPPHYLPSSPPI